LSLAGLLVAELSEHERACKVKGVELAIMEEQAEMEL
jgi:hypothetical protein